MAISEAARSELYTGLSEVIGPERAETLMSAIPLHDLDEVATKADIAMLRAEIKADIAGLRTELTTEIGSLQRSFTFWILTLIVAIIGAMSSIAFLS